MNIKKTSLTVLLCLLANQASALGWYRNVLFGYGITRTAYRQNMQLSVAPAISNTYLFDLQAQGAFFVGFGLGKFFTRLPDATELGFGAEVDLVSNNSVAGLITPIVNPAANFDTLGFSFDEKSYVFLATAKFLKDNISDLWGGYFSAGVGGSVNRLSNYNEWLIPGSTATPMTPFANYTSTTLAFSFGAGLTYALGQHSQLAFGYRYLNTGRGQLGVSPAQSTTSRLSTANLAHHLFTISAFI